MENNPLTRIINLFEQAKDRVVVVSAYVRGNTLNTLLRAAPLDVTKTVYARWRLHDLVTGASDIEAQMVAQQHQVLFFAYAPLHAKIYIADDRALVGSANATGSGLGGTARDNLEVLVEQDANHPDITSVLDSLTQGAWLARPFTESDIERAKSLSPQTIDNGRTDQWLPESTPEEMLSYLNGERALTERLFNDSLMLGLSIEDNEKSIKHKLQDNLLFTTVSDHLYASKHELDRSRLITLLADKTTHDVNKITDRVDNLSEWLHRFSNTIYRISMPDNKETPFTLMYATTAVSPDRK